MRVPRCVGRVRRIAEAPDVITGLFQLLNAVLSFMVTAIFIAAIVQTLISFNVLDTRNRFVWTIADILYRVTEPVLRPIRNVLPHFGGLDLSPWVAILLLNYVARPLLTMLYTGIAFGNWTLI